MSLTIPDEIVQATGMSTAELAQEIAVLLFQKEKLTIGQASKLANMSLLQFQHLLASHQIPVHYDVADFEADINTLRAMGRLESYQTMLASEQALAKDWNTPEEDAAWQHL